MRAKRVWRFRVTLQDIDPPIWRLIDIPENCTFWDLEMLRSTSHRFSKTRSRPARFTNNHVAKFLRK